MNDKIDKISEDIVDVKVKLGEYNALLGEHIKRTVQLEERVAPIEKHVAIVGAVGSWLLGTAGLAVVVAIIKLLVR